MIYCHRKYKTSLPNHSLNSHFTTFSLHETKKKFKKESTKNSFHNKLPSRYIRDELLLIFECNIVYIAFWVENCGKKQLQLIFN